MLGYSVTLALHHLGGAFNQARGCGVHGRNLVENQFLVGQRLSHNHSGSQRHHRGGTGPVHALYQLEVILFDHIEGQIALNTHRLLHQQILHFLPHRVKQFVAHHTGLLRVCHFELGNAARDPLVYGFANNHVLLERLHGVPQVHFFLL